MYNHLDETTDNPGHTGKHLLGFKRTVVLMLMLCYICRSYLHSERNKIMI